MINFIHYSGAGSPGCFHGNPQRLAVVGARLPKARFLLSDNEVSTAPLLRKERQSCAKSG
jgi:hypothetical protein